ncbi:MAG: polysaccharide biosynthesis tyrosine autokinase [Deltaproteobacteria bacterium]|nr:polysaccharide biosynthesis tyrosine autokinase [Deltaproteobacteria bacterium]
MDYLKQIPSEERYQLPPPRYSPSAFPEEKEVNLRDYWKVIQKRRWTIIAFFLIVLITTSVATFTMEPIYRGTTTIQINKENPQIVDFKEIFAVNTMDMDYYQTQYKLLESRTLAKRIIQTLKLGEHPEFLPKPETPFQKWKSNFFSSIFGFFSPSNQNIHAEEGSVGDDKESNLINPFLGKLKIEPIRNSRLVKIHFDSRFPELSAKVPNILAATFIQQSLENRFVNTEKAREWLIRQLEGLKAKVERAEEALQSFGSKHDIISLEEKENVIMQRLTELNEILTKAESDRIAKEALYNQVKDRNIDAIPAILENRLIMDLKQTLIHLEAQYMKLSKTFKPGYPEMARLKNQMETVQKRIDSEINKIITGIRNDYESSLRRETLLRQSFEKQKVRVTKMKEKAIQYNILKREADTNKELYAGLLQKMKEAGVSAGITASNIQIVDQAEWPANPYKPNKRLNLLLAAVVGLFLGVGLAFFFEYLDNTVKTPEEVEQMIRLPSFGMVPEISYERKKRLESGTSCPVELVTFGHPKSMLSEAYRSIRTSILLSFSERPPKRIAITSPNPTEGKTTTVINTAIALSQTGAQVIVVDSDLRKPKVHKIFNGEDGMGLSNFLSGHTDLESVIRKTEIPNLFYIAAGPLPPNPSELIGSNLFKGMMESLGEKFDHIVIDCYPVLGFADTIILSTVVDGVILVVWGGKTPRETLHRAKEVLFQVNAKILGVVINRVNIHRSDYGYYYYRYHYYYGKEGKKKKLPYASPSEEKSVST